MKKQSIWQKSAVLPHFAPLSGDVSVHTAIIGGGLTGLLTAHLLRMQGISALVLEAGRIGGGQTGRTTAKITSQHNLRYASLTARIGEDAARQYLQANEAAIDHYAQLIRDGRIDCGFTPCSAYLYSVSEASPLEQEMSVAQRLGADAVFTRETELPFPVAGAVRFRRQARFHPLRFLAAISDGLNIREQTRVLRVEDDRIHTDRGTVKSDHIVFACHYPFVNAPGWYFPRMHQERSYVLALKTSWLPRDVYLGVDGDGLSLREAQGQLLLGGAGHRTGENPLGGQYDALRSAAGSLFPDAQETGRWSAQDVIAVDQLPCIGQYARAQPRWYVATGFAKWGMTTAMVAAQIISGMITGHTPEWADVFSPQRPVLTADNAGPLLDEAGHALRGLIPGTGSPRCPHMGCALSWNPEEQSWDCPCHGSRFAQDGTLLDGPAQRAVEMQGT